MKLIPTGLIIAGGAVVVGAAAYAGIKMYKDYTQKRQEETMLEKAKEEFAACAQNFSGLYEPLYMMEKGRMKYRTGVMGDWVTRTANLTAADHYRKLWILKLSDCSSWSQEQAQTKIKELLAFALSAGVCRDHAEQITVDGTTYKRYSTFDGELIEEGNSATVKTPYWFMGEEILEKGVIEKDKRGSENEYE